MIGDLFIWYTMVNYAVKVYDIMGGAVGLLLLNAGLKPTPLLIALCIGAAVQ
jgi:hypothetical protein